MSSLFKFPGYILLIALFVLVSPYLMLYLPNNIQDLFNNSIRVLNNTFKILDIGSGAALSVAEDVSGGVAFASKGKNPFNFI